MLCHRGKMPSGRHKEILLTHQHLVILLAYDPYTGIFTWRETGKGRKRKIAGRVVYRGAGRREIGIDNLLYVSSRLAWFYMTMRWPPNEIDHKDLNSLNDAFDNLREATRAQNGANRRSRNPLGKGVRYQNKKFQARLSDKHLGTFSTRLQAAEAYKQAAAKKFGEEFVRV